MSGQHVCVLRVRVPLLPSDMTYGVVRQGFDPGLQVFLCQQQGVHTSCVSDPLLFAAPKWASYCHTAGQYAQVIRMVIVSGVSFIIFRFHKDNKLE
jgi:hypothetical protein